MARLIVKVKYMKPGKSRNVGRYAKYIATREGVDKIDESAKYHKATTAQKELIEKITKDHPESKMSLEYEDYLKDPTIGKASEFITQSLEENYEEELDKKSYADYIATRPRAERIGKHGLFSDDGMEIDLKQVSREINEFPGTIWTMIVSIRREDAQRLGFDKGERWRDLVRSHTDEIADNFGIRQSDLKWYGAFHDESYHPHIHLIIYDQSNRAFLNKGGIENLKSVLTHEIFKDEMLFTQNEKSERRDQLRLRGKKEIDEILQRITEEGANDNTLAFLLIDLASRLKEYSGRKVYGYLKKADKELVNTIIDEIGKIPAVAECYDLWYEKQEELTSFYKSNMPKRIALSANPEFKALKNSVIRAACEIDLAEKSDFLEKYEDRGQDHKTDDHENYRHYIPVGSDPMYVSLAITRLCNNVSRIFEDKFRDNPENSAKVDRKLRRRIHEKEIAHGIKHQ